MEPKDLSLGIQCTCAKADIQVEEIVEAAGPLVSAVRFSGICLKYCEKMHFPVHSCAKRRAIL